MDETQRKLAEDLLSEGLPADVEWLIGETDREQLVWIDGDDFSPGGVYLAKTWPRAITDTEHQALHEYFMEKYGR